MLRALGEYEIGDLKTLLPFHQAILQTPQWANAETCRDLIEDRAWLKTLAFPKVEKTPDGEAAKVERDYTVESPANASMSKSSATRQQAFLRRPAVPLVRRVLAPHRNAPSAKPRPATAPPATR